MLHLPEQLFDTAGYQRVHTDLWGKFKLDDGKHIYSASPGHVDSDIWVKLTAEYVTVMDLEQHPIVTHRRLYGDETAESMEWLPHLKYIARKPRSLRNNVHQLPAVGKGSERRKASLSRGPWNTEARNGRGYAAQAS